ncbi:hypothetical protein GFL84_22480 [Rhizobium leguminosarum bv. viciae]|nr:hypothetical protein [Rhizobium leguminosarum bv. viciae]
MPVAPSSGCRHLLPAGEKRFAATSPSPFSPWGEGARRADEGATRTLGCTFYFPSCNENTSVALVPSWPGS